MAETAPGDSYKVWYTYKGRVVEAGELVAAKSGESDVGLDHAIACLGLLHFSSQPKRYLQPRPVTYTPMLVETFAYSSTSMVPMGSGTRCPLR